MTQRKLVLAVIDGLRPAILERALRDRRVPALQAIVERGTLVPGGAVAAFPSVTPVCAATIATGSLQDAHHIPAMNWFSRSERRYVEYGSSFAAARRFGIARQLTDTVFNMNMSHLAPGVETVFETLDDAGLRTAGTTYLIYRGRHRHEVSRELALTRLAGALWRRHALGPRELFYADIFASRETGCRAQLGMPGVRDQHAGCVARHLVEHELFDFLLLSLPDNDAHSHKHGPDAQLDSIVEADRQIERMMQAAGGAEPFLDRHAAIVVADHSHVVVRQRATLGDVISGWHVLAPGGRPEKAELALCPSQRSAMVYVLAQEARSALAPRIAAQALAHEAVELAMWRSGEQAVIAGARGELRFAPAGHPPPEAVGRKVRDERGRGWRVEGELGVLGAELADGMLRCELYPDALARVWAALACPTSGDVLLSAAAGWELADWGGTAHVGGGSHGSLHRDDSVGALAFCGLEAPHDHGAWSIADVAPMVRRHFGLAA